MGLAQDKGWLKTDAAAKYIGITASTLNQMRIKGTGPQYLRLGRAIWYEPEEIEKWIVTLRRSRTSGKYAGVPKQRRTEAA